LLQSRKHRLHWAGAQPLNLPLPAADHPKTSRRGHSKPGNPITYPSTADAAMLAMLQQLKLDASTRSVICVALSRTKMSSLPGNIWRSNCRVVASALELGDHGRG
jgi:hypothetical protein